MTHHPEVAIIGDKITITADESSVTVNREDWNMIRDIVDHHNSEGRLGELYRHPAVSPAKWRRKA